jgi:hypothetical protein
MRIFRHRKRIAELDARVAEAAASADQAAQEAEKSEQRYQTVRRQVVRPLREAAERNQFAAMLRKTLTDGEGN